ncbi:MAG: glycosyltransferase [Ferruginibacter sp.]
MTDTEKQKPVIVAVGLYTPGTGFTRVFESLFARLSEFYSIHWLGIAYRGPVLKQEHYTLYPNNLTGGDMYGGYAAAEMAGELNASCVWLLNDLYILKNYNIPLSPLKKKGVKLLAYVPLDGEIKDDSIMGQVLFLDKIILYNQWAQDEVTEALESYCKKQNCKTKPELFHIYHGVDTDIFSAISENKKISVKEKIFSVPHAAEAIFILNANRYNERKDIATTLRAFATALPGFERKAYLCLHMPAIDALHEKELILQIDALGISSQVILNPLGKKHISSEQLGDLYRACSIGINSSLGEGWGLISFEHAACGAVQLVPDHTAAAEVWLNTGILLPKHEPVKLASNPFLMYRVNEQQLSEQLILLVNDAVYLDQLSERCCNHAQKDIFNWNSIAEQWKPMLQKKSISIPV